MIKYWFLILFFCSIAYSCNNHIYLEKSREVKFILDESLTIDSLGKASSIYYKDVYNIKNNFVNTIFLKDRETRSLISTPTFFTFNNVRNLIYPGEKVLIVNDNNSIKLTTGKSKRTEEINVFRTFNKLANYPQFANLLYPTLENILREENALITSIHTLKYKDSLILDSLYKQIPVSKKFKKLTNSFLDSYDFSLTQFYLRYEDSLDTYDIFDTKLMNMLPLYNNIENIQSMQLFSISLNEYFYSLFDLNIRKVNRENIFQIRDSIIKYFKKTSKDYLLTQLYYYAIVNNLNLTKADIDFYYLHSSSNQYESIIRKLLKQEQFIHTKSKLKDIIITTQSDIISLENFIQKNKNKFIFFDMWATWCAPCLAERPFLNQHQLNYRADDIIFINLSIDKQRDVWAKWVFSNSTKSEKHYLLLNKDSSRFYRVNNIDFIPRYIIYDKNGKIINSTVPSPSSDLFKPFIDSLLKENK